ncbi:DUF2637 domain-containing protein [Streptomyces sp. NPDC051643]|uniref:DUF2637 domain-containing protein n=1 Tax=Streptomyces sp. NPDC051643 TaxID=3365665 RepID=UPI0037A86B49
MNTWIDRARTAALWLRDTGLGAFGFALVLVVAASGWAASFIGLHKFGMEHMGLTDTTAWLVPITFDGAPAGLSIVVARAATHGRPATVWRLLIVAFTGLSSWINYEHIEDHLGRIVASFMPPSAVILFEGLMSEARQAAIRQRRAIDGTAPAPRLHPARWLFAPWNTLMIVRRYVLWLGLPEGLQSAAEAGWKEPKRRMPWGATKLRRGAAPDAPQSATAPAPEAPPTPATNTPRGATAPATAPATVSLQKTPQGATAPATNTPHGAAPVAPQSAPTAATMAPPTHATATPQGAPTAAPVAPQGAAPMATHGATTPATAGTPRTPRKPTRKRSGSVTRNEAKQALRDLYDRLGKRPLEGQMTELLEDIGSKHTSRQYAGKLRAEIEMKEPHLAALGSTNVTALTGTGP